MCHGIVAPGGEFPSPLCCTQFAGRYNRAMALPDDLKLATEERVDFSLHESRALRLDTHGAPDKIRTCDLCLRRAALYPERSQSSLLTRLRFALRAEAASPRIEACPELRARPKPLCGKSLDKEDGSFKLVQACVAPTEVCSRCCAERRACLMANC